MTHSLVWILPNAGDYFGEGMKTARFALVYITLTVYFMYFMCKLQHPGMYVYVCEFHE